MKSILINKEEEEIKYPRLMIAHGDLGAIVVLFNSQYCGVVVYSERKVQPIGYYIEEWVMSGFKPFYGIIQLTSDKEE